MPQNILKNFFDSIIHLPKIDNLMMNQLKRYYTLSDMQKLDENIDYDSIIRMALQAKNIYLAILNNDYSKYPPHIAMNLLKLYLNILAYKGIVPNDSENLQKIALEANNAYQELKKNLNYNNLDVEKYMNIYLQESRLLNTSQEFFIPVDEITKQLLLDRYRQILLNAGKDISWLNTIDPNYFNIRFFNYPEPYALEKIKEQFSTNLDYQNAKIRFATLENDININVGLFDSRFFTPMYKKIK